jgi:isopenicillin-N epimerase
MARFGRSLRDEWLLDRDVTYLNHGTVGAPPRRVLEHQRAIVDALGAWGIRWIGELGEADLDPNCSPGRPLSGGAAPRVTLPPWSSRVLPM